MTDITIVIPWCDRVEIIESLTHNSDAFTSLGAEVIVVNCGGDASLISMAKLQDLEVSISWLDLDISKFNKCLAHNYGVFEAKSETVILLDCDILLSVETLRNMFYALNRETFVTVASVIETNRTTHPLPQTFELTEVTHSIEFVLRDARKTNVKTNTLNLPKGARSGPGIIMLYKEDFMQVQGMKSNLVGWGWDDIDLIARLQISAGLERKEVGCVQHISSLKGDSKLGNNNKKEEEARNYLQCLSDYAIGDFLGTLKTDISKINIKKKTRLSQKV